MKKLLLIFFSLMPFVLSAQINISFPMEKAVFQRNSTNQATIYVAGNFTNQAIDKIEAKLTVIKGGISTSWIIIQNMPQKGAYYGSINANAGWYRLDVRSKLGTTVVDSTTLNHVGVGEVFVIAGQSNAQGELNLGSVDATDERVINHNYDGLFDNDPTNDSLCSVKYPPFPTLSKITASAYLSKYGRTSWCYGKLGDLLASTLNVPIAFYNAGANGSSSLNWKESSEGLATVLLYTNKIYCLEAGSPYSVLKICLNYYANLFGVRAVLWHQGETDSFYYSATAQEYENNLTETIAKSRSDFGSNIPWVISRVSYNQSITDANVISGQNNTVTHLSQAFFGPNTDTFGNASRLTDNLHFSGTGLIDLANAWNASLNSSFFNNSTPISAKPLPSIQISCNGNNQLILTAPAGFSSYIWVNNNDWIEGTPIATTQSITKSSGTYRCYLKDNNGNILVTQAFTIQNVANYCNSCSQPTVTNSVVNQATCPASGNIPPKDASIQLTVSGGDKFIINPDGLSNYSNATVITGGTISANNLASGTNTTFRIFNGNNNCYLDKIVLIPAKTCDLVCNGITYLSDVLWSSSINSNGSDLPKLDKSFTNKTITLKGITYSKGLGENANSETIYNLNGLFGRFIVDIGIDDDVLNSPTCIGNSSLIYKIYKDTVLAYQSPIITQAVPTISLNLDISGANQLKIIITAAGDNSICDHADWAGARFHCIDMQAPTPPSNLVISAIGTKCSQFKWSASSDNMEVLRYLIFVNNNFVGYTYSPSTSYNLTNLVPSTPYSIIVKAEDFSGNISIFGATSFFSTLANMTLSASPKTINEGQQSTLNATGCDNGTVFWSNGVMGASQVVNPSQTNTYKAICQMSNCVNDSITIQVILLKCQPNYAISTPTNNGTATTLTYPAMQNITSSSQIINSRINYQAGKSILLQPGFSTDQNDVFSANIATCTCSVPPPIVSISNSSLCSISLKATGCNGTVIWSNLQTGSTISINTTTSNTYSAICTNSDCNSISSNSISIPNLPTNWATADIGTPPIAGCTNYDGSTLNISGTGKVLNENDQFHYVYQNYSSTNVSIIAKISSQTSYGGTGIRSGILIRTTNQPDTPFYELILENNATTGNRLVAKVERGTQGQQASLYGFNNSISQTDTIWLKIDKVGNTLTASFSKNNGTTWTTINDNVTASPTINFGSNYQIGFNVYNDNFANNNLVNQTIFSNITINGVAF